MRSWSSDLQCPRCDIAMFGAELETFEVTACGGCGGLWLDKQTRRRMARKRRSGAVRLAELAARKSTRTAQTESKVGCTICNKPMRRKRVKGTHVVVDVCAKHGTWFDREELPKVAHAVLERRFARAEAKLLAAVQKTKLTRGERNVVEMMRSPDQARSGSSSNVIKRGGGLAGLAIGLVFELTIGRAIRKRRQSRQNDWFRFLEREDLIEE